MYDKELSRNGSGYVDPTAYKALISVQKEEKAMNNKTGEIWEFTNSKGFVKEAIIIKDHGNCCTILILQDENNGYCDISINGRGLQYTDSRKLQYVFDDNITSFIRKLSDQEFEKIMEKVTATLGIKQKTIVQETEGQPLIPCENIHGIEVELEKTKAQLEVYKGLYEGLLKDVLFNG